MYKIRNVKMEDLPQLVVIEHLCFPKEEALFKLFVGGQRSVLFEQKNSS